MMKMIKIKMPITRPFFKLEALDFAWQQFQIIQTDDVNDFGYVNTVPHIARAQRYNKDFKVYVSCGLYDLATPCFTAENFMNDNSVDMSRVVFSEFEAGHMMYNHQPSFDRFLKEVNTFISK